MVTVAITVTVSSLCGTVQAADTVMVLLKIPGVRREDFDSTRLAASIQRLLPEWGYPGAGVTVHAVFNSQQHLQ